MTYTGALPSANVYSTWSENVLVWDIENDAACDLTDVTEITLKLVDQYSGFVEMSATMTDGAIEIPVLTDGVVQWRVEQTQMFTLAAKAYRVVLVLETEDDSVALILGTFSVIQ